MTDLQLYLLVPLAPLAGALIAGLGGRRIGRAGAHWVTIIGVAISFAASCLIFLDVLDGAVFNGPVYTWLVSDGIRFEIGFLIDRLSALMMVVVSFVSLMVHVYTVGYMADDPGYQRFFAYIALFTFSMLMLVMANNFLQLFFGWEAVGLVSYLLIGFWYTRPSAIYASLKAFLVNRVGDFGFLLAIALVLAYFGTLDYAAVFNGAATLSPAVATGIALLLFMGACGKSAQLPLHVWLPDAMEGPTPVSALIHAATMVTAGVYMVARSHVLFERSGVALEVVAWVGVATALYAASVGLVQTDIKRVLAYSTVSQLGYMFAAVGLGAYAAGIFHLVTHAFFKALLFLGAGSVIHGLSGEQDLRKMGGLAPRMVTTTITMTVGAAGLAGVPGLAGFFSKDEILHAAFTEHRMMWALLLLGAFMTAFYTFRLLFLTFFGGPRMSKESAHHVHESPPSMTIPLVVLAILTVVAGWALGLPSDGTRFARFLAPVFPLSEGAHDGVAAYMLVVLSFVVVAAGFFLAWYMYMSTPVRPETIGRARTPLHAFLLHAWYFDRFYDHVIVRPYFALCEFFARFDLGVIDGIVNLTGRIVVWWSAGARRVQTGYVVNYALTMAAGAVALVSFLLTR